MKKKENINALILVIYMFLPSLTLPVKTFMGNAIVPWSIIFFLIVLAIIINLKSINKAFIYITIILNSLFLINMFFVTYTNEILDLYVKFLMYSMIALFFTMQRIDYYSLYKYWYYFAYINVFIWLFYLDSIQERTTSYMTFGVFMTYSFAVIFYSYLKKKKKIDLISLLFIFTIIFIFGNRSATLSIVFLVLIFLFVKYRKTIYVYLTVPIIFLLIIIVDFNKLVYNLIYLINHMLNIMEVSSYSVWQLMRMLENGLLNASMSRNVIYEEAIQILKIDFLPKGVGYYQFLTGVIYPHNIFLDILLIFGFLGIPVIILMIIAIIRFYQVETNIVKKEIVSILLIINSVRLMFSSTLIFDVDFWIVVGLISTSIFKKSNNSNKEKLYVSKNYNNIN